MHVPSVRRTFLVSLPKTTSVSAVANVPRVHNACASTVPPAAGSAATASLICSAHVGPLNRSALSTLLSSGSRAFALGVTASMMNSDRARIQRFIVSIRLDGSGRANTLWRKPGPIRVQNPLEVIHYGLPGKVRNCYGRPLSQTRREPGVVKQLPDAPDKFICVASEKNILTMCERKALGGLLSCHDRNPGRHRLQDFESRSGTGKYGRNRDSTGGHKTGKII